MPTPALRTLSEAIDALPQRDALVRYAHLRRDLTREGWDVQECSEGLAVAQEPMTLLEWAERRKLACPSARCLTYEGSLVGLFETEQGCRLVLVESEAAVPLTQAMLRDELYLIMRNADIDVTPGSETNAYAMQASFQRMYQAFDAAGFTWQAGNTADAEVDLAVSSTAGQDGDSLPGYCSGTFRKGDQSFIYRYEQPNQTFHIFLSSEQPTRAVTRPMSGMAYGKTPQQQGADAQAAKQTQVGVMGEPLHGKRAAVAADAQARGVSESLTFPEVSAASSQAYLASVQSKAKRVKHDGDGGVWKTAFADAADVVLGLPETARRHDVYTALDDHLDAKVKAGTLPPSVAQSVFNHLRECSLCEELGEDLPTLLTEADEQTLVDLPWAWRVRDLDRVLSELSLVFGDLPDVAFGLEVGSAESGAVVGLVEFMEHPDRSLAITLADGQVSIGPESKDGAASMLMLPHQDYPSLLSEVCSVLAEQLSQLGDGLSAEAVMAYAEAMAGPAGVVLKLEEAKGSGLDALAKRLEAKGASQLQDGVSTKTLLLPAPNQPLAFLQAVLGRANVAAGTSQADMKFGSGLFFTTWEKASETAFEDGTDSYVLHLQELSPEAIGERQGRQLAKRHHDELMLDEGLEPGTRTVLRYAPLGSCFTVEDPDDDTIYKLITSNLRVGADCQVWNPEQQVWAGGARLPEETPVTLVADPSATGEVSEAAGVTTETVKKGQCYTISGMKGVFRSEGGYKFSHWDGKSWDSQGEWHSEMSVKVVSDPEKVSKAHDELMLDEAETRRLGSLQPGDVCTLKGLKTLYKVVEQRGKQTRVQYWDGGSWSSQAKDMSAAWEASLAEDPESVSEAAKPRETLGQRLYRESSMLSRDEKAGLDDRVKEATKGLPANSPQEIKAVKALADQLEQEGLQPEAAYVRLTADLFRRAKEGTGVKTKLKESLEAALLEDAKQDAALKKIADWLGLETLETRGSDQLDFRDTSRVVLGMALRKAYAAGSGSDPDKVKGDKSLGKAEQVLLGFAKKHLGVSSFTPVGHDAEDFFDAGVWGLKAALQAAYQAGAGKKLTEDDDLESGEDVAELAHEALSAFEPTELMFYTLGDESGGEVHCDLELEGVDRQAVLDALQGAGFDLGEHEADSSGTQVVHQDLCYAPGDDERQFPLTLRCSYSNTAEAWVGAGFMVPVAGEVSESLPSPAKREAWSNLIKDAIKDVPHMDFAATAKAMRGVQKKLAAEGDREGAKWVGDSALSCEQLAKDLSEGVQVDAKRSARLFELRLKWRLGQLSEQDGRELVSLAEDEGSPAVLRDVPLGGCFKVLGGEAGDEGAVYRVETKQKKAGDVIVKWDAESRGWVSAQKFPETTPIVPASAPAGSQVNEAAGEGQPKASLSRFLGILSSELTQYDQRQSKGKFWNPYALGHYMKALSVIRDDVEGLEDSDAEGDLRKLQRAISAGFTPQFPPATKVLKAIDLFLEKGLLPKMTVSKEAKQAVKASKAHAELMLDESLDSGPVAASDLVPGTCFKVLGGTGSDQVYRVQRVGKVIWADAWNQELKAWTDRYVEVTRQAPVLVVADPSGGKSMGTLAEAFAQALEEPVCEAAPRSVRDLEARLDNPPDGLSSGAELAVRNLRGWFDKHASDYETPQEAEAAVADELAWMVDHGVVSKAEAKEARRALLEASVEGGPEWSQRVRNKVKGWSESLAKELTKLGKPREDLQAILRIMKQVEADESWGDRDAFQDLWQKFYRKEQDKLDKTASNFVMGELLETTQAGDIPANVGALGRMDPISPVTGAPVPGDSEAPRDVQADPQSAAEWAEYLALNSSYDAADEGNQVMVFCPSTDPDNPPVDELLSSLESDAVKGVWEFTEDPESGQTFWVLTATFAG